MDISGLYKGVRYCVEVNNQLSNYFCVSTGVKQWCILSPTLFNLFINDLVYSIKQKGCGIRLDDDYISILMFADNVVL